MTSEEVYLLHMSLLLILFGFLLFVIVFSALAFGKNREDFRRAERRLFLNMVDAMEKERM